MVGAFVLANNKENLNMDGCLWYFGGISSSLKAVFFGGMNSSLKAVYFEHTNIKKYKNVLLFLAYYRMDNFVFVFLFCFDDRLYSTILRSLEQTHCARMCFYMSD